MLSNVWFCLIETEEHLRTVLNEKKALMQGLEDQREQLEHLKKENEILNEAISKDRDEKMTVSSFDQK